MRSKISDKILEATTKETISRVRDNTDAFMEEVVSCDDRLHVEYDPRYVSIKESKYIGGIDQYKEPTFIQRLLQRIGLMKRSNGSYWSLTKIK